ncbi:hypothetical protein [Vibrio stylophorae]|uniref:hypothetical protein n=1 Tax=Vibrio stylophorae TaxID=659351 RepID=UPI001F2DB1A4|nr:hypothetical protein [Vibrio stylophorae]
MADPLIVLALSSVHSIENKALSCGKVPTVWRTVGALNCHMSDAVTGYLLKPVGSHSA